LLKCIFKDMDTALDRLRHYHHQLSMLLGSIVRTYLILLFAKIPSSRVSQPSMLPKESILLEELVRRLLPKDCLEWGSGQSTVHFSSILPKGGHWHSIEHDERWFRYIRGSLRDPTHHHLVGPNRHPWTDANNDGALEDLRDYVGFPRTLGKRFDLILIDGRAREHCLRVSSELLSERGLVVVHDAVRGYYFNENVKAFRYRLFMLDGRGRGGFWFASNEREVMGAVASYQGLWLVSTFAELLLAPWTRRMTLETRI
jgi:predicted O-methyltransferase YrrM